MDFKILWTPEARARLREAVSYIAQDDPAAAERVGQAIFARVELLARFPELGRVFRKLNRRDVRETPAPPYRIIYRVHRREKIIRVLSVWHGARQEPDVSIRL